MAAVDYAKYGLKPEVDYSAYGLTPEQAAPAPQQQEGGGIWDSLKSAYRGANDAVGSTFSAGLYNPTGEDNVPYKAGHIAGDIGSFIGGGELLDAARLASESLPYIGNLAKSLGGEWFGGLGRKTVGNAIYGADTNPGDRLGGAERGAVIGAGAHTAGKAIDSVMPENLLKNMISPEALKKNIDIAGETNTNLGDIVQSPFLKRTYENLLSKNPFSGADSKMAATAGAITDKSNDIVNGYLGNTAPQEVESKIGQALMDAKKEQTNTKNALYKNAEDLADQAGLKLELPTFAQKANQYSNVINDQNFLKFEPEAKQLLSRLSNYQKPVQEVDSKILGADGNPMTTLKFPSLKESNILAGKLGSLSNQYRASPAAEDRYMANILGDMGKALKTDIGDSIGSSGSQELKTAFEQAEKNYKENFSPFLDKDVYKFTHGGKSAEDILSTFIKTGSSTDKGEQISKLMDKLNPQAQDLVKYSYLSRAMRGAEDERSIDPRALKNLWSDNKLGQKQKVALFPSLEERQALDNHTKLIGMNSEALNRMFNPQTGQRGLDRGILRSLPGAIPSRYFTNKLTSPEYRNQLLQKMQAGGSDKWSGRLQALLMPALVNNLGGQQ